MAPGQHWSLADALSSDWKVVQPPCHWVVLGHLQTGRTGSLQETTQTTQARRLMAATPVHLLARG